MVVQYQKGNKAVLDDIYIKNKGIIGILANKFYTDDRITEKADLVQEGFFGLLKAVEKFDSSKGVKFTTYLTKWVYAKMHRYVTTRSTECKEISLYTPTVEDMQLEETIKDDTDYIEEADYRLDNQILHKELDEVMYKYLTLREQEVLKLRYGFDCKACTFIEIADMLDVSRSLSGTIHNNAIRKIRRTGWYVTKKKEYLVDTYKEELSKGTLNGITKKEKLEKELELIRQENLKILRGYANEKNNA